MNTKKTPFKVSLEKQVRVIIDSDCSCEADDHYAISHALMSPKLNVAGILSVHHGKKGSQAKNHDEILHLLELMEVSGSFPVLTGGEKALADEAKPVDCEAARFIIQEAMKEDSRPLFYLGQACLTNLASALLMKPEIAKKLTAIWIGGARYPEGGWEFNLFNDIHAANAVMNSGIELWQVPIGTYSLMKVSIASIFEKVYPCGEIGRYLATNLANISYETGVYEPPAKAGRPPVSKGARAALYPCGESWELGDNAAVGLLLSDHEGHYDIMGAPLFDFGGRYIKRQENPNKIRVYRWLDSHFILDDLFAKLKYNYS